jgi:hypothetical protein
MTWRERVNNLQMVFHRACGVEFRKLTFEFAEANDLQHAFNEGKKMAGHDWLENFMKSYKTFNVRIK